FGRRSLSAGKRLPLTHFPQTTTNSRALSVHPGRLAPRHGVADVFCPPASDRRSILGKSEMPKGVEHASTCVVGLQWGDEAKGKIVDLLTDQHDLVVRFNGGANAGHTVVAGDKVFKFSLLPTGILRPNVRAVIANGVVVHPPQFLKEVQTLRNAGIPVSAANLALSNHAHVIFPYH